MTTLNRIQFWTGTLMVVLGFGLYGCVCGDWTTGAALSVLGTGNVMMAK